MRLRCGVRASGQQERYAARSSSGSCRVQSSRSVSIDSVWVCPPADEQAQRSLAAVARCAVERRGSAWSGRKRSDARTA
jgi:hypothetical protein